MADRLEEDEASNARAAAPPPNVATAYPDVSRGAAQRLLVALLPLGAILALLAHRMPIAPTASRTDRTLPSPPEHPPVGNDTRIAACFTGHVGTLGSVYEQNLKVLSALSTQPVSTFFVLDLDDDYRHSTTNVRFQRTHEIGSLQAVFDEMGAKTIETYSTNETIEAQQGNGCIKPHAPARDEIHYGEMYASFVAAARCFKFVEDEERRSGMLFDWVLRLRPDMHIVVKIPPVDTGTRVHLSGAAIALIPRIQCPAFFSAVEAFNGNNCRELDGMGPEPCHNYSYAPDSVECLIIKWLKRFDIIPSNGVFVNRRIVYPETES